MIADIREARHYLIAALYDADEPTGDVVEMLATITDYLRENDPEFDSVELIGYRAHIEGCRWSNGVILGFDFDDPRDEVYHVYSFNLGQEQSYRLGKNLELSNGHIPYRV